MSVQFGHIFNINGSTAFVTKHLQAIEAKTPFMLPACKTDYTAAVVLTQEDLAQFFQAYYGVQSPQNLDVFNENSSEARAEVNAFYQGLNTVVTMKKADIAKDVIEYVKQQPAYKMTTLEEAPSAFPSKPIRGH